MFTPNSTSASLPGVCALRLDDPPTPIAMVLLTWLLLS